MNRRDFLQAAAMSAGGAVATTIITPQMAKAEEIGTEAVQGGQILTSEDLAKEAVDIAQFADNLARVVLNAKGPITIERRGYYLGHSSDEFVVRGIPSEGRFENYNAVFFANQHPRYKLVYSPR